MRKTPDFAIKQILPVFPIISPNEIIAPHYGLFAGIGVGGYAFYDY